MQGGKGLTPRRRGIGGPRESHGALVDAVVEHELVGNELVGVELHDLVRKELDARRLARARSAERRTPRCKPSRGLRR
jgi:hypothetical protein